MLQARRSCIRGFWRALRETSRRAERRVFSLFSSDSDSGSEGEGEAASEEGFDEDSRCLKNSASLISA